MPTHEFDLIVDRRVTDDEVDALRAGEWDDLTPSMGGASPPEIAFARQAESLIEAVISAIEQVERATRLRVIALDADPLVTIQDIAERTGRTRESVRLLIKGQRGRGGFPQPEVGSAVRRRMWRWSAVSAWMHGDREELAAEVEAAVVSQAVNGWLQLRSSVPQLTPALSDIRDALTEHREVA